MAGFEYSDLKGNGVLLKAVEYLRMLPKWKEQPGTLRSGFVEYAEYIARHLLFMYGRLEGKPLEEVANLSECIDPIHADRVSDVKLSAIVDQYGRALNEWHLELAILRDVVDHILDQLDGPDWVTSSAHLAQRQFSHLVETCPFPQSTSPGQRQGEEDERTTQRRSGTGAADRPV